MGYIIKGEKGDWELVIGLEVHCQVISESKLFSGASAKFGSNPNESVSFIDAGFPGMLPVINEYCVEQAVKTGLGLKAKINRHSVFARKNYFYADLPNGYQISQYDKPIIGEGVITIDLEDGTSKNIGIERLHLEMDAGKSMHDHHPRHSIIDLNRSGVALMEIVSKPDMRSPEEAGAYLKKLRAIVRYLKTCDGNMDEGSMRCDANVSVRPLGNKELRTRCEIKNVNSIKFVMQAIEYEAKRHVEVYEKGGEITQETRLFDSSKGTTRTMRGKENANDYRYFPDPDLLPLDLDEEMIIKLMDTLPELPDEKKKRYERDLGLSSYDASIIVSEQEVANYFDEAVKGREKDAKKVANFIMVDLFSLLNKEGKEITQSPISPKNLGELVDLVSGEVISGRIAKEVFELMAQTDKSPKIIVEEKGLVQVTDTKAIEAVIDEIMAANPDKVAEIKSGKDKLIGWFVGQVMRAMGGKANPAVLNDLLKKKLG